MAPMIDGTKFNNKLVRQALVYAIDREGHRQAGASRATVGVVNSHIIGPEWALNPNLNKYEYNPDKAQGAAG